MKAAPACMLLLGSVKPSQCIVMYQRNHDKLITVYRLQNLLRHLSSHRRTANQWPPALPSCCLSSVTTEQHITSAAPAIDCHGNCSANSTADQISAYTTHKSRPSLYISTFSMALGAADGTIGCLSGGHSGPASSRGDQQSGNRSLSYPG